MDRERLTQLQPSDAQSIRAGVTRERLTHLQQLEAELTRKNAALAETAALLVLSKKSRAIWGDSGEC